MELIEEVMNGEIGHSFLCTDNPDHVLHVYRLLHPDFGVAGAHQSQPHALPLPHHSAQCRQLRNQSLLCRRDPHLVLHLHAIHVPRPSRVLHVHGGGPFGKDETKRNTERIIGNRGDTEAWHRNDDYNARAHLSIERYGVRI